MHYVTDKSVDADNVLRRLTLSFYETINVKDILTKS